MVASSPLGTLKRQAWSRTPGNYPGPERGGFSPCTLPAGMPGMWDDMASGTDKRLRAHTITVRLSDDERDKLTNLSSRSGLAIGAFMRAAAFGDSGPRAQRRPPADHVALRQILGHCARIGNNLNQIAKHLNTGGQVNIRELKEALAAFLDIRDAILTALGMKTTKAPPDDHQGLKPRRT
jgi:hypothetical protein